MLELIERRFSSKKNKIPSLIIIDGGRVHLMQAQKRMKELGFSSVNIISISKGVRRKASFDSIHLTRGESKIVKEGSVFHNFIQEIRDETHRFAISSQKRKVSKSSLGSSIDKLSGVGDSRKKLLLRYFGSLEQIKRASVDDLSEVSENIKFLTRLKELDLRVILFSNSEKERIKSLLPNTTIYFSNSCNCGY